MKTLFAALMLVTCATAQANANVQPLSTDPVWLKDMQVVSCKFDVCKNWTTNEIWDDNTAPDGLTIEFPESYTDAKIQEIHPAVVEWIKVNGIPHPWDKPQVWEKQ
jgi:hypothetical protein